MNALLILINEIITLYLYTLFVYVVMGLLIQFQMINNYNKIINTIFRALISIHEPLLGKIRKYVPLISSIDLSPVIVILLLSFLKNLITDYRLGL
ncbi:MAG: YggT family protein [Alphaproteobacteria bacterium]|nr:YggT family protein [Alphaproteobacteria bacterium]